ncbi:hypothetical protein OHA40_28865 [Nocardia sp. NBC_00508]|uniref:hypothetical protein n=1 Tax=Nocardia sp. NBC_00508 TaxID=2975992 RepID=UPI002E8236A7|nr:hypothetical protein [Nocardia sp. NBC_00508]WUD65587.1 hypothetical protein OHA40_28865 [Nocardia sp. NBC_00508]
MTIATAIRTTVLASALVLGTATAAHAEPIPAANDNVVCFISAIPPYKTGAGSIASINFGFKVHCTGRPSLRSVNTKLYRYDPADGKHYVHSERNDDTTDPDVETLYSASCSAAGILYQFHTKATMVAFHGNWGREYDDSITIGALC